MNNGRGQASGSSRQMAILLVMALVAVLLMTTSSVTFSQPCTEETEEEDCPNGFRCVGGQCEQPPPPLPEGPQCESEDDCPDDVFFCVSSRSVPDITVCRLLSCQSPFQCSGLFCGRFVCPVPGTCPPRATTGTCVECEPRQGDVDNPRCPGGFCTRLGECAECNPQQEEIDNPLCPSGTFCTGNSFLDPQAGTCTSTPPTGADLSIITKTDVPDPVTVGTPLTYTVQFMNNGPEPATNITFTDRLPAGVTFMSASKDCSEAGDTVTCEVVSLESGASVGVEIVVLPTVVGTLTNTARVTSTTPDPFPDNNERTEETIVTPPAPPPADLAIISKTDVPDPVTVGTLLLYTVQVVNNGPEIATEVTITDRLPAEATFFSASEICRPVNGTVICELGSLESGASTEVFIVVLPTVVGTITNTAQVMSTTFDPNPDNNERTEDTTVIAFAPGQEADVAFLEKRDMPDPVTVGTPLTYNLSFINNGPGTATLITITDTLPTGVTFVSASGGCQEANGTVTCQFGNIGSGTRFGPIIVVLPTVVGTLTNTARVMSTAPDPNPNNNIGTEDTTVIPPTPGQVIVNELIDFDPLRDTFATTPDPTGCPAGFVGTFSFAARLPNVSDRPLAALQVLVVTLTNGNLLQNADGGPGGVGAILTVPAVNGFADDLLSPGEFVDVPFVICLTRIEPFIFLVNVLGVVLP